MQLSLSVSGKQLGIATAVIVTVAGIVLGYGSYTRHKENEAALAAFNQQAAAFDSAFATRTREFSNMSRPSTSDDAVAVATATENTASETTTTQ